MFHPSSCLLWIQVYKTLEPVLIEKAKAEERLKASSSLQWVIIRPGGLKSEPATGKGEVTLDNKACGAIHREDVAELVYKCIFSDKADGKVATRGELLATRGFSFVFFSFSIGKLFGLALQVLSALDREQVFGEQANFEAFVL